MESEDGRETSALLIFCIMFKCDNSQVVMDYPGQEGHQLPVVEGHKIRVFKVSERESFTKHRLKLWS